MTPWSPERTYRCEQEESGKGERERQRKTRDEQISSRFSNTTKKGDLWIGALVKFNVELQKKARVDD